jgi:hypothetical protein
MKLDRRRLLTLTGAAAAAGAPSVSAAAPLSTLGIDAAQFGVRPDIAGDQSRQLQRAIDETARKRAPLAIAPESYRAGTRTRPFTRSTHAGLRSPATGSAAREIIASRFDAHMPGIDGTIVLDNWIEKIDNRSGGTGQYGNAINVFRAVNVIVRGNRVSDCAFSAVRGNAASNNQIASSTFERSRSMASSALRGR